MIEKIVMPISYNKSAPNSSSRTGCSQIAQICEMSVRPVVTKINQKQNRLPENQNRSISKLSERDYFWTFP
jgi:hypothetical protein